MTQDLNYAPEDILHIARGFPISNLRSRGAFLNTIGTQVTELEAHPEIATFNAMAALEGFEPSAALCRLLSVYDADMRDDLLLHAQHPNLTSLGAILTIFAPQASDQTCFQKISVGPTKTPWMLSLAQSDATVPLDIQARELIEKLQRRLANIPLPDVEIWHLRDVPKAPFEAFSKAFGEIYKSNGAAAAQEFLHKSQNVTPDTELARYLRYRFNR